MPPLVSIIIPCHNQGRYLAEAVSSSLDQTYRNVEILVVDDGSTDDTARVMEDFVTDSRVRFFRQPNQGPSVARNNGVANSRGEFLNFLDADDTIAPRKVERQVPVLIADSGLGFAYCDITHIDEEGTIVEERKASSVANGRTQLSGDIFDQLFAGGYFPPHSPLVRRSAFDRVGGFDPALRGCCDWDLWLRLAAQGFTAHYLDERLASYRLHSAAMSRNVRHMREDEQRVVEKILAAFPQRAARAYSALRIRIEETWEACTWLNADRAALDAENARLKQRAVVLDECPSIVRYPIYAFLLFVKRFCSRARRILRPLAHRRSL